MGPLYLLVQLPMALLSLLLEGLDRPIAFAMAAADDFTWAHSFFWQVLLMPSDGPISFPAAAADNFAWAHFFLAGAINALGWAHYICSSSC